MSDRPSFWATDGLAKARKVPPGVLRATALPRAALPPAWLAVRQKIFMTESQRCTTGTIRQVRGAAAVTDAEMDGRGKELNG